MNQITDVDIQFTEDNYEWSRLLKKAREHRFYIALQRGAGINTSKIASDTKLIEEINKSFLNGELSAVERDDILTYLNSAEI